MQIIYQSVTLNVQIYGRKWITEAMTEEHRSYPSGMVVEEEVLQAR